jgi:hypothetical protein
MELKINDMESMTQNHDGIDALPNPRSRSFLTRP